jgi:exodeoxyribonuclease V alpha subunit
MIGGLDTTLPFNALDLAFADFLQQAQPTTDPRHSLLAALVSHQYGRGHACLDLQLLREHGVAALGWDANQQALLPPGLVDAAPSLPWALGPASPLVLDGARLYLRRNWQAEQVVRDSIMVRLVQPCAVVPGLKAALDSLFGPTGNASSPDWQKVACAVAARGSFTLITGGPGTGKTTTVARLLGLLQSQALAHGRPLRMALAAPTGKAAARLGQSMVQAIEKLPADMQLHLPMQAKTLHKLLQVRPGVQATGAPALALDVLVVDEASMVDLELMARLMAAVPLSASLILLGDKDQLASVEAGAVMAQLCAGAEHGAYTSDTVDWLQANSGCDVSAWAAAGSRLAQHTVMLRQSHRFSADSVIGQWAVAVNAGQRTAIESLWSAIPPEADAKDRLGVTRLQPVRSDGEQLTDLVRSGWHSYLTELSALAGGDSGGMRTCNDEQALALLARFGEFQVLCALREGPWGVTALNRAISLALGFPLHDWYAGRPVMVTRNDYFLDLMNGDVGICLPTAQGLRVAFAQASAVRWLLPSRLDSVETVFAMTVHKSQGSEYDHVALVLPDKMASVLTRELLYTGITRAKAALTLVVPQVGVLRQAAANRVLRSGGLSMAACPE